MVVELIGQILFEFFFLGVAKILLPILSLGKWKIDNQRAGAGWFTGSPWSKRGDDGILYIGWELGMLLGILLTFAIFLICLVIIKL